MVVNSARPQTINAVCGVPQGAVLEASLFLLYVDGISDGMESLSDDHILYRVVNCGHEGELLQEDKWNLRAVQ